MGLEIGFIGAGIMGSAMAKNLVEAGHKVRIWNRTRAKAEAIAGQGATIADTPREAAHQADVLITMVADTEAVEAVVTGEDGALAGLGDGVWLQMSTVGVSGIERCAAWAAAADAMLVDALVLGTKKPAEDGTLTVLAAGPDAVRQTLAPVLEAVGKRTIWCGDVGQATRLKLVANTWVLGLLGALAETIALAEALEVSPRRFLDAIENGPLDCGYAHIKGGMMLREAFPPAFPLEHALKDARLICEAAARQELELKMMEAMVDYFVAAEGEHRAEDMAAVFEAVRPHRRG